MMLTVLTGFGFILAVAIVLGLAMAADKFLLDNLGFPVVIPSAVLTGLSFLLGRCIQMEMRRW